MKTLKSIWDWYSNGGIYLAAMDAETGREKTVLIPFKLIIPFVLAIILAVLAIVFNSLTVGVISVAFWAVFFISFLGRKNAPKEEKDAEPPK